MINRNFLTSAKAADRRLGYLTTFWTASGCVRLTAFSCALLIALFPPQSAYSKEDDEGRLRGGEERSDLDVSNPLSLDRYKLFVQALVLAHFKTSTLAPNEVVPDEFQEEIFLDQCCNVANRRDESLDMDATYVQFFHEFHVPVENVRIYQGGSVSEKETSQFFVQKNGQRYARFFVPNLFEVPAYEEFLDKMGIPERYILGVKVQGKSTFHVWDPEDPKFTPVRIKFERQWGSEGRINGEPYVRAAIETDNLIHRLNGPHNNTELSSLFYKENFGLAVSPEMGVRYAYLVRQLPEAAFRNREGTRKFLPLHGFLGSQYLPMMASRNDMDRQIWLREIYVQKLARLMASLNLDYGLWIEAHTQNLSVLVDTNTGELIQFFIKDLADLMPSPLLQVLNGREPLYDAPLRHNLNLVFTSPGANETKDHEAGFFSRAHLMHSITAMTNNIYIKYALTGEFLREYISSSGLVMEDLDPVLVSYIKKLSLRAESLKGVVIRLGKEKVVGHEAVFAMAMQEIADKVTTRKYLEFVHRNSIRVEGGEKGLGGEGSGQALGTIFQRKVMDRSVSWAYPDSGKKYDWRVWKRLKIAYIPLQRGILAVDVKARQPLGYVFMLSDDEQKEVDKYRSSMNSSRSSVALGTVSEEPTISADPGFCTNQLASGPGK